jgi:ribosomal protein S18 acetylase RimI-like enzyme
MNKIRTMTQDDRLFVLMILEQTQMFTQAEIDVALELIDLFLTNRDQKDYFIYVAENEFQEITGYACFGPTPATEGTFDLYWIAVSPNHQNQGIGKQLLEFSEAEMRKLNGRLVIIETSGQEKYSKTQQFYFHNQYLLEARIKDFYRPLDDRLIYVKRLNDY